MRLREPQAADYSTVFSWLPTADEGAFRVWAGPRMPFPPRLESFAQDLRVKEEFPFVLEGETGEVVGFGQVLPKADDHAHLIHLIVDPEHRNRGYGEQLVRLFVAEATSRWTRIRSRAATAST